MKTILKFKGRYFTNTDDAVHVDDDYVQQMIDEVTERLLESKEETDFSFSDTGDTMVIGFKWEEEGEISIIVTQDYDEACLLSEKNDGNWEPIEWGKEAVKDELYDLTVDELIEKVISLSQELEEIRKSNHPDYNPRREI